MEQGTDSLIVALQGAASLPSRRERSLLGREPLDGPGSGRLKIASWAEPILPQSLKDQSDEELMLLCRAEHKEALEELFKRYSGPLYQYIYRQLGNPETAADLLQETFFRVYAHRKRYKPTARFSYWLYRIARNLCVDEKRRYWNRNVSQASQVVGEDGNVIDFMELQATTLPTGSQLLEESRLEELVKKAIETLSDEQKQVMLLHKYQGMAYKDIAEVLGITTESVKQRAYRAHLKLREQLKFLLEDEEAQP